MHRESKVFDKIKQFIMNNIVVLNVIIIVSVFISSTFLFYKQITANLNSKQYSSDLILHFKFGTEGKHDYSLMQKMFGVLWNVAHSKLIIAFFLGIVVVITIFTISFYIKKVIEYLLNKNVKMKYFIPFAFFSLFIGAIYIPLLSPVIAEKWGVYHIISAQVWHNSTFLAMRASAPVVLVAYYTFYKKKEVKICNWLVFVILLSITNALKPNFFMAFAPSVLVFLIFDFCKQKGKNLLFSLKIGAAVICSMPIMIYQTYIQFGETDSGIKVSLETIKEMAVNAHSYFWIIANLAVPLLILFYSIKKKEINRIYVFGWLLFLVGWLESLFIVETGLRAGHGNFAWQNPLTALFLFIVSVINLMNMNNKNKISKKSYYSILGLLSLNIICGLIYYARLLLGNGFLN